MMVRSPSPSRQMPQLLSSAAPPVTMSVPLPSMVRLPPASIPKLLLWFEDELVLVMVLVVPSARTIFAPAGRATAIEAVLVKFTPLRVRVFVVLSHSALVVSGVPSLSPVVSSASALLPSS